MIKQATCKESGEKSFTCTACKATKTETIAKLSTHTYDHACDTDCNICGAARATSHRYGDWRTDVNGHWKECSECKVKKDAAAHIPGAEPTETAAQSCTACGYVIQPALGHTHSYAENWTTDENGHWYACSGCEEQGSYAAHDFESACDSDCSICDYTREINHSYEEKWTSDETNHWHICTGCGLKVDEAAHEPGAEATETTAQTCTICDYEIAPALGGETTEPTDATENIEPTDATEATTPNKQDAPVENDFPWWIVIVVAVVVTGVIVFVIVKKKKS